MLNIYKRFEIQLKSELVCFEELLMLNLTFNTRLDFVDVFLLEPVEILQFSKKIRLRFRKNEKDKITTVLSSNALTWKGSRKLSTFSSSES